MIIKVRTRKNKIVAPDLSDGTFCANMYLTSDSFRIYDNCSEVLYGKPSLVDRELFDALSHKSADDAHNERGLNYDKQKLSHIHFMLKDSEACEPDENYFYNIVEWRNTVTGEYHQLRFDTVIFICDDKGATLEKVIGYDPSKDKPKKK
jgi:hypothetical protein